MNVGRPFSTQTLWEHRWLLGFLRAIVAGIFVLGLCPFSSSGTSFGTPAPSYQSKLWTPGEDPSRSTVQAIAQTSDGFLWIGTQDGLARFDGEHFEWVPVGEKPNQTQRINALCTDSQGDLWVGTSEGLFQLKDGRWIAHIMPLQEGDHIMALRAVANGSILIGTLTGLVGFEREMLFLWGDASSRRSMGGYSIRSISEVHEGEYWVSAADNIIHFQDGDIVAKHNFGDFRADLIRSVCRTRTGSIWMGCTSGLIQFKESQDKTLHFTKADGLSDNTVTAIYEDRRGNLWIGTYGGLCRFVNGTFVIETTPEGDPYNQILCFFEDHEDNLWVGSKEGLHRLNVQPFTTYTTRHGLTHNNVLSVYEDSVTNLWIGTWGGGLHCLKNGELTVYSSANTPVMRNDLILAIHGSRDGGIWFGEDYDGGLYRLRDGQVQHYGEAQGLDRNAIRALLEDQNGRLLIGLAAGYLKVLEQGKFFSYGKSHGLPTNAVRCLLQAQDGDIWIGTEAGLVCWKDGTSTTFTKTNGLSNNTVLSLYEDAGRTLWIGTAAGLSRLRPGQTGKNAPFTSCLGDEFAREAILEILEDDFANLWMATRSGMLRVAKKAVDDLETGKISKLSAALFGRSDGMASQVCVAAAKPSAFKSKDGRLWFATTKGLAVTDPKLQIARNEKPPPVIVRLKTSSVGETKIKSQDVVLPPGRGELEFHFTALSYTAPEKNRFKYKLQGLDNDWIDAGGRREAFYNNVPPGHYTFHVIAANNDGVWNSIGSSIQLSLLPHFWQTWWFKSSAAVLLFSLIAGGTLYATRRRMQMKLERLEQQSALEKERARIAQDMHDDLGVRLTEILLLSNVVQNKKTGPEESQNYVGRIASAAEEVVGHLDNIVWAVNPENDSLDRFVGYLNEQADDLFKHTTCRFRWNVPAEIPHLPLSSEVRHNLFLVTCEALHNAIKHSQASEVKFSLKLEESTLSLTIEDNGKGFSISDASLFGNGLKNMEKRMKSIGGRFEVTGESGKGTRVSFGVPVK